MELPRLSPGAVRTAASTARTRDGHVASAPVCNGTCSATTGGCNSGCVCACNGNVCGCVSDQIFPAYPR